MAFSHTDHLEISIIEVARNQEMLCPPSCPEDHGHFQCYRMFKPYLMHNPTRERLIFTVAIAEAKNISRETEPICILPDKTEIVDSLGHSFDGSGYVCTRLAQTLQAMYGCSLDNIEIPTGSKSRFLLVYPEAAPGRSFVKLNIDAYIIDGWSNILLETITLDIEPDELVEKKGTEKPDETTLSDLDSRDAPKLGHYENQKGQEQSSDDHMTGSPAREFPVEKTIDTLFPRLEEWARTKEIRLIAPRDIRAFLENQEESDIYSPSTKTRLVHLLFREVLNRERLEFLQKGIQPSVPVADESEYVREATSRCSPHASRSGFDEDNTKQSLGKLPFTECEICGKPILELERRFCSAKCLSIYHRKGRKERINVHTTDLIEPESDVDGKRLEKPVVKPEESALVRFNDEFGNQKSGTVERCPECGGRRLVRQGNQNDWFCMDCYFVFR